MIGKLKGLILIILGLAVGAYLFSDTQPRSVLRITECGDKCLTQNELVGLFASVGMQRFGNFIPDIQMETDKTIVIRHPRPQYPMHYVVVPKKDIKNIGQLSEGDQEYLVDAWAVINAFVQEKEITSYRIITNGPGYQSVSYLHFHIIGKSDIDE